MSRVLNNFCVLLYKCAGAFILGGGVLATGRGDADGFRSH